MKMPEDPFVRELLPEFIETWMEDINNQLRPLVESKNENDLYRFGHTLKGSCFQFGLDDTAKLGIELMGYARAHDWDSAMAMEKKLIDGFLEMKKFVEENS